MGERREDRPEPPRLDPSRSDLLRGDIAGVRREVLAAIEKVDEGARQRDGELHKKIDDWYDDLDTKVDEHARTLVGLTTQVANLEKKDEFADVPWYARPSYVRAMGLALAAVLAALITSLGIVLGWGRVAGPTPAHPEAPAEAPAQPADEGGGG